MKYAVTDYDGCEYITAGKRYEILREDDDSFGFDIIDDEGDKLYCVFKGCACIGNRNWRIEMGNDIEHQGNDFEVKYDEPEEFFIKDGEFFNASKHGFEEYATRYIRADLVSQKQSETSDVTRSDIELRDYFAGKALMSMLTEPSGITDETFDKAAELSFKFADAMMEARKNK